MNTAQTVYLDTLRAAAAQLVLLGHIYSMVLHPGQTLGIGDFGVVIFFILSGFLVSYTSIVKRANTGYTFSGYFKDRFFRIFTPYLPALVLIVLLDSLVFNFTSLHTYEEHYNLKDLIASISMMQQHPTGYFFDKIMGHAEWKLSTFGSARPLWTVASEWWLYVAFGLLYFYPQRLTRRPLWAGLFLIVAITPLFNTVAGTGAGLSLVWMIMAFLAYLYHLYQEKLQAAVSQTFVTNQANIRIFIAFMLLLFLLITARIGWISYFETGFKFTRFVFYDFNLYLLLMLFITSCFLVCGNIKLDNRTRFTRFTADYSYSLYLIHYSLIYCMLSFGIKFSYGVVNLLVYYLLCNITAILFWWLFERNHKKIKLAFTRVNLR